MRSAGLRVLAGLAFGVVLAACSSYVKRGSALYSDGRYVEAAEVFERTEDRLGESTPRQRAEYGLYRGMTLLVLGDLKNAHRWLAYAYEVERALPGTLRPERRALLDRGWFELGQRLRRQPMRSSPPLPGSAIAASGKAVPPPPEALPPPPEALPPAPEPSPGPQKTVVPR